MRTILPLIVLALTTPAVAQAPETGTQPSSPGTLPGQTQPGPNAGTPRTGTPGAFNPAVPNPAAPSPTQFNPDNTAPSPAGGPNMTTSSPPGYYTNPQRQNAGRGTWQHRFDAANTTHDGRLTLEQAKAGHMPMVVRNFSAIDTDHKGYVTKQDIQNFLAAHQQVRRSGAAHAPSPAYSVGVGAAPGTAAPTSNPPSTGSSTAGPGSASPGTAAPKP